MLTRVQEDADYYISSEILKCTGSDVKTDDDDTYISRGIDINENGQWREEMVLAHDRYGRHENFIWVLFADTRVKKSLT